MDGFIGFVLMTFAIFIEPFGDCFHLALHACGWLYLFFAENNINQNNVLVKIATLINVSMT